MCRLAATAARELVLALPSARLAVEREQRRVVLVPAVEETAAVPRTTTVTETVIAVDRGRLLSTMEFQSRLSRIQAPIHHERSTFLS